jgi:GNAT superfamily N-acetyltransferase
VIRYSRTGDRQSLHEIFSVCFDDSESYVNFFLDNGYSADNCLVWEEDGLPVAMLHLCMADFISDGKAEPAMYIYAAATMPGFRRCGIMSKLIDTAVNYGVSQGCLFTFLLPACDKLYDYYGRLGFETAFGVRKARLFRSELKKTALKETVAPETIQVDNTSIFSRRMTFFNPAVQWREKEFAYALAEWRFTGGEVLNFNGGYALCRERDGYVEVKEACGDFAKLASALLLRYYYDTFTFFLPPYANYPFETHIVRYGMLISLNPCVGEQVRAARPYVNLMLD